MQQIYNIFIQKARIIFKEGGDFAESRKEMVEYIRDALAAADDYTIEQVYEYLLSIEY